MNNSQFLEAVKSNNPLDYKTILDITSNEKWNELQSKDKNYFIQNSFQFIKKNISLFLKEELMELISNFSIEDISVDEDLWNTLINKSYEFKSPLLTDFHKDFSLLDREKQTQYIIFLNSINYTDYYSFNQTVEGDEISYQTLHSFYFAHFYIQKKEGKETVKNKIIPCENFNLFILQKLPAAVIGNHLLTNEDKHNLLEKLFESDNSDYLTLFSFFEKANNLDKAIELQLIKLFTDNLLLLDLNKTSFPYIKKIFNLLNNKERIDTFYNHIQTNKKTYSNLLKYLSLSNSSPVKTYSKFNFLQTLLFGENRKLITSLCVSDDNFMEILNEPIVQTINCVDYQKELLDIVILRHAKPSLIKSLYIKKFKKDELNYETKLKLCSILFISLEKSHDYSDEYTEDQTLDIIQLLPLSNIKKCYDFFNESLSKDTLFKLDKIINMLSLSEKIEHKQINSKSITKHKI